MKKLIQGIVDFRKGLTEERRTLFSELALGQKPDTLFIACSDSRVVPNLFASTNPGDLFVVRNMGNLIPPSSESLHNADVPAALAFAVLTLKVRDIIVCGHSECGAMQALSQGVDTLCCPYLASWLHYSEAALQRMHAGDTLDPSLSPPNQLSQINVLQQMEHMLTYPFIQEGVSNQTLRLHGWWFDIAHADVYCYEPLRHTFILMDEQEAALLLQRLKG